MAGRTHGGPGRADAPRASGRRAPRSRGRRGQGGAAPVRLTARGALLAVVLILTAAALIGSLLRTVVAPSTLIGVVFVAVSLAGVLLVRRRDVIWMAVTPPLTCFVALLLAETLLALPTGAFAQALAIGMGTRLAELAPWLFGGTALALALACFRGLPDNIRELREDLSGRAVRRYASRPEE
ncbi:DUF6542 domain-containing protein [Allonocardiopsis opalescens]|uniref:Putative secreted protein with PEP-CTERM sorting signal n=1 Tax=Allonocardiopsis opalescens TaxID=1144618 RepID=A0A2T0QD99_9ACTN|nr:DUF6542 domain-containing protein [Allonocardiopsis opalescens]PRY01924.1 putative secreted protein with PEP-CTERM sorting signal [Allonocardiopsis opalescens]